ncbi:MAG: hypothetical protein MUP98_14130, partial [Candidatus Aminicenantes bacterium]|nr:hypothetical protein [Candidatus Aminicenantes bacterium]
HDEAISFLRLPRRKAPRNGEVGRMAGFSRRERYSVPGTTPLGKRSIIRIDLPVHGELVLKITVLDMLPHLYIIL